MRHVRSGDIRLKTLLVSRQLSPDITLSGDTPRQKTLVSRHYTSGNTRLKTYSVLRPKTKKDQKSILVGPNIAGVGPEIEPREPELDARRSSDTAVKMHPEMSTRPQKCINIVYSSLMNSNHESSHSSVCGWNSTGSLVRGQDSFCCFLPNSISQVINDCNESLVYVLVLQPPCQHGCSNLEADKLNRRTWTCQP